uniref:NADH dehydrogenase subunit 6 n=1 Tax=Xylonora corona TaxID=2939326 RepID=UPI0020291E31|nr:NADH dehydrogenase subunit 6 [Xylonora corona]UPX88873.1 NADH dehydrogenase subunit 6 [Xylonora corona]
MWSPLVLMLFIWNLLFFMSNPLSLIGGLSMLNLLGVFVVSLKFSFLLGFVLLMCMVSGVLVLVSYCVALLPLPSSEGGSASAPTKKSFIPLVFGLILISGVSGFSPQLGVESFLFTDEWLKLIVFMSAFLFLAIVVCINVCSKYSGALLGLK